MKISALKSYLQDMDSINFRLPNGQQVPAHFHLTEIGLLTKHYVDCGGTVRQEKKATMQLWVADDTDHRLVASKFLNIIKLSDSILQDDDLEIEVEYQMDTIGKYGLGFDNGQFILMPKFTDCLAREKCEVPVEKKKVSLSELSVVSNGGSCTPGGGCC